MAFTPEVLGAATAFAEGLTEKFAPTENDSCFETYHADPLRKYIRIYKVLEGREGKRGTIRYVHCFIDAQGNVLKPKSFTTPAEGARANLLLEGVEGVLSQADAHGYYLYLNR